MPEQSTSLLVIGVWFAAVGFVKIGYWKNKISYIS
jgi:hypothetical protein